MIRIYIIVFVNYNSLFLFDIVTFPLDITKTRLQTQGEIAAHLAEESGRKPPPYRGMLRTAIGIGKIILFLKIKFIIAYKITSADNFTVDLRKHIACHLIF